MYILLIVLWAPGDPIIPPVQLTGFADRELCEAAKVRVVSALKKRDANRYEVLCLPTTHTWNARP